MTKQTREQTAFYNARARCQNPNHPRYADWGGRGIEFRFSSFEGFILCLGLAPDGTTIDRVDNNGHYEAGNVRWATALDQRHNRRLDKRNPFGVQGVVYFDKKKEAIIARVREGAKFLHLYYGKDLFEAICARKSYEAKTSQ